MLLPPPSSAWQAAPAGKKPVPACAAPRPWGRTRKGGASACRVGCTGCGLSPPQPAPVSALARGSGPLLCLPNGCKVQLAVLGSQLKGGIAPRQQGEHRAPLGGVGAQIGRDRERAVYSLSVSQHQVLQVLRGSGGRRRSMVKRQELWRHAVTLRGASPASSGPPHTRSAGCCANAELLRASCRTPPTRTAPRGSAGRRASETR